MEQWDITGAAKELETQFGLDLPLQKWLDDDETLYEETLLEKIFVEVISRHTEKIAVVGEENMRRFEKQVLLQILDHQWKEHLAAMDYLRQGIHLRGYAQKNPKQEYKREAFELFTAMLDQIKRESVRLLTSVQVPSREEIEAAEEVRRKEAIKQLTRSKVPNDAGKMVKEDEGVLARVKVAPAMSRKVGRNEPCPCGSGKKFKQCCGKLA